MRAALAFALLLAGNTAAGTVKLRQAGTYQVDEPVTDPIMEPVEEPVEAGPEVDVPVEEVPEVDSPEDEAVEEATEMEVPEEAPVEEGTVDEAPVKEMPGMEAPAEEEPDEEPDEGPDEEGPVEEEPVEEEEPVDDRYCTMEVAEFCMALDNIWFQACRSGLWTCVLTSALGGDGDDTSVATDVSCLEEDKRCRIPRSFWTDD